MSLRTFKNIDCKNNSGCIICPFLNSQDPNVQNLKSTVFFKKGQYIYSEGARPQGVFCVYEGKVKIVKSGSDGKEQIIHLAKTGDMVGLNAYFIGREYSDAAVTMEDAYVCQIPKETFDQVLAENIKINILLRKYLCRINEEMEDKIISLSQRTVRERLALNILYLSEYFGIHTNDRMLIDLPLSREEMANLVGTATETVIRILSDFKKEGIVCFNGKKITIININGLKKAAEAYS